MKERQDYGGNAKLIDYIIETYLQSTENMRDTRFDSLA